MRSFVASPIRALTLLLLAGSLLCGGASATLVTPPEWAAEPEVAAVDNPIARAVLQSVEDGAEEGLLEELAAAEHLVATPEEAIEGAPPATSVVAAKARALAWYAPPQSRLPANVTAGEWEVRVFPALSFDTAAGVPFAWWVASRAPIPEALTEGNLSLRAFLDVHWGDGSAPERGGARPRR